MVKSPLSLQKTNETPAIPCLGLWNGTEHLTDNRPPFKLSGVRPKPLQHFLVMPFRLHLLENMGDFAILPDDKRRPQHPKVLLPVHVLLPPYPILLRHRVIRVREQRKVQLELLGKLRDILNRIRTDPEHRYT